MFVGHFAVGFASNKFAPRASLLPLLAAPLLADMLWPIFLFLGWEHVRIVPGFTRFNSYDLYDFPWSHSLFMDALWATLFSAAYFAVTRYRPGAVAIWIGVISHWILDWITHTPDMPLYPGGGPHLGLSLWNHVVATMTIELAMLLVGVYLYASATQARDRVGKYAFLVYVLVLLFAFISDRFGGSPASATASEAAHAIFLPSIIAEAVFLAWAWWFDYHRSATGLASQSSSS
jgi:LexA-binding, inner membrane-associated putative hydrolase